MQDKEIIEIAKKYKRKVAGSFVLVDADDISSKVSGTQFIATKKIDGFYQGLFFEDGCVRAVSTSGKVLKDIPCLAEAASLLSAYGLKSAVFQGELYAVLEDGKRERVGDVSVALSDKGLWDKLYLAPFDITQMDGEEYTCDSYLEKIKKLSQIFNGKLVRPVEYRELSSTAEVKDLFKEWVEDGGAEGIVLHSELPIVYKIKRRHPVDGVIVGFTYGEGDRINAVRDVAVALMREDGKFQIVGVSGNGFTEEERKSLKDELEPLAADSEYIITDSRNVAFQMVKPKIVAEFTVGDMVAEGSDGIPKMNPLLTFDYEKGYLFDSNTPGVSLLHFIFTRFRDDKTANESDVRISQVTDICPFSESKVPRFADLPKSEVIAKRIFTKESGEKMMIQKYLVWKTNKEESGAFPSYVFFYTDFSSGRKEMLKRDLRISSDKDQALSFMDSAIAENVKKGWTEVK